MHFPRVHLPHIWHLPHFHINPLFHKVEFNRIILIIALSLLLFLLVKPFIAMCSIAFSESNCFFCGFFFACLPF
jgi:hypothetical protein